MGTYMTCQLKGTTDSHIKQCNEELEKLGFPTNTYNGVKYGAFVTLEQLTEDARFMSEDPQGLKQCSHMRRPVQPVDLEKNFFWFKRGQFCQKLSSSSTDELKNAMIVAKWAARHKLMVDQSGSDHFDRTTIKQYMGNSTV